MGAIIVGVRLSRPDMGGTRATENTRMYVHGADDRDASINVDGLSIDAQDDNGIQGYYNEAMIQEIAYTTSAIQAESAKGGVRMNMIGREGGNVFSGQSYISTSPSSWQSDNLTQELIDRGLPQADGIAHISDLTLSQGGPVVRDKLWFYLGARQVRLDEIVQLETPWRLHDLRRSFRSQLSRLGTPEVVAERCLNHGRRGLAAVYDQWSYLPEKKSAFQKWSDHLAEIGCTVEPAGKVVALYR